MSIRSLKHLAAVLTLADVELQREEFSERSGVFRALLSESMPYLRNALFDMKSELDAINDERHLRGLPPVDEVHA